MKSQKPQPNKETREFMTWQEEQIRADEKAKILKAVLDIMNANFLLQTTIRWIEAELKKLAK